MRRYVQFPCPHCAQEVIVRCDQCRETINVYKCAKCGGEGP